MFLKFVDRDHVAVPDPAAMTKTGYDDGCAIIGPADANNPNQDLVEAEHSHPISPAR